MKKVVAAGIFNNDDEILLCRKQSLDYYIFPGGKSENLETDTQTLRRELQEEINCQLSFHGLVNVFENKTPDGVPIQLFFYIATISGTPSPQKEIVELKWYRPGYSLDYPLTTTSIEVLSYIEQRDYFKKVLYETV